MTPNKVTIHNFCGIGHVEEEFKGQGVTRICGATGLGKSTIADAILWAQYGLTKNKTKGDEVVNRFEKKDCYVSLEYDDFKIIRHRKSKKFKNDVMVYVPVNGTFDDHTESPIGDTKYTIKGDNKATQDNIDKLIGMSFDVYVRIMSFGQGDSKGGDWGDLTDAKLKQAMTESVGLEEIDLNKDLISLYKKDVAKDLEATVYSPVPLKGQIDTLTFKQQTLRSNMERNTADAVSRNQMNADRVRYVTAQVERAESTVRDLTALEVMSEGEFLEKSAEFDDYREKLKLIKIMLKEEQDKYMAANTFDHSIRTKLNGAQIAVKQLGWDLSNIEKRIGTLCGECGKEYSSHDMAASMDIVSNKVDAAVVQSESLEYEAETSGEALLAAKESVEMVTKAISDLDRLLQAYNKVVTEYNEGIAHKACLGPAEEQLLSLKEELIHTEAYVKGTYNCEPDIQHIATLDIEIAEIQKELDGVLADIESKESLVRALNDVSETLETSKGLIIDSVTVPLNENIQECVKKIIPEMDIEFQTMTKLKNGEYREKFCIKAVLSDGASGYNRFSGGQKAVCNFAISLGFAMTIRGQHASLPNLMFIDEGFNAMDIDLASKSLNVLLDMDISNVYVMSHDTSLKELIPQTIELERKDGKTFIKEV